MFIDLSLAEKHSLWRESKLVVHVARFFNTLRFSTETSKFETVNYSYIIITLYHFGRLLYPLETDWSLLKQDVQLEN